MVFINACGGDMKIVINKCYGGFSVSNAVLKELGKKCKYGFLDNEDFGIEDDNFYAYRANKDLIKAIEKVGIEKSSGELAKLRIVDIPDDIEWEIDEYDGIETVREQHRSW